MLPKKILFCLALVFIISSERIFSQPSNLTLLDTLARRSTREICFTNDFSSQKISLNIAPHPASWLIEQAFFWCSGKENFLLDKNSTSTENILLVQIQIYTANISYSAYPESGDSLIRNAELMMGGKISSLLKGLEKPIIAKSFSHKDTIARNSISTLETAYEFTKAPLPERPPDLWKELAEPIIYVSAAALTLFLFFTVRSK